jgi:hypothetical protein
MESRTVEDYDAFQTALVGVMRPLPAPSCRKTDIYYDRSTARIRRPTGKMNKHFFERLVLFQKSYLFLSFAPVAVKTTWTNVAVNALRHARRKLNTESSRSSCKPWRWPKPAPELPGPQNLGGVV